MPGKSEYFTHLRVRISSSDKAYLRRRSSQNGEKPNISRSVKDLIDHERKCGPSIEVDGETLEMIEKIAKALRREPRHVVKESIQAVLGLIHDQKRDPLIVLELRLAKQYLGAKLEGHD